MTEIFALCSIVPAESSDEVGPEVQHGHPMTHAHSLDYVVFISHRMTKIDEVYSDNLRFIFTPKPINFMFF
jgi:hypothetical protein